MSLVRITQSNVWPTDSSMSVETLPQQSFLLITTYVRKRKKVQRLATIMNGYVLYF